MRRQRLQTLRAAHSLWEACVQPQLTYPPSVVRQRRSRRLGLPRTRPSVPQCCKFEHFLAEGTKDCKDFELRTHQVAP
jgi:hypothetical protein